MDPLALDAISTGEYLARRYGWLVPATLVILVIAAAAALLVRRRKNRKEEKGR